MNWGLVPTLLAVVETGSLSAAARKLGISQPTAGRQVAELEAQLGLTLFTRAARGLVPTEAALQLAERGRTMRHAAAEMALLAEGRAATVEGTVRLTASEIVASYVLPPILSGLLEAEPGIEIELVASNTTENLLFREADIAVRMVQPEQDELIARKLGELDLGIFAHERYLARAGTPSRVADLQGHVFIGYDRSELMIRAMGRMGLDVNRRTFRYRTDSDFGHVQAILAGVGIGAAQVGLMSDRPGLRRLLPDLQLPRLPVWLAAHRELSTSLRVRRVFDFVAEGLIRHISAQNNVRSTTQ